MRLHLPLLLILILGSLFTPAHALSQETQPASPYRPGAVIVGFEPGARAASAQALLAEGFAVTGEISELNVVMLAVPVGQEQAAVERLSQQAGVAFAELDYQASAQLIPNDPDYSQQWALAKIGAPAAWEATTGSSDVVIAVLDTGVDLNHPDLASRLWVNPGEIPNNGKDDDGNGMIDDVRGWRFYHSASGTPSGDAQIMDHNGHGTHVTGVAAAATNNATGAAGVTWNSPVMTVKVLSSGIYGYYSDIAAGILYALNNGADIMNISAGGDQSSETLCSAVANAVARGKLVVAAAGNGGNRVLYPAACPGALAVGATDPSDQPASFTNPGTRVDLSAPGVDIYSTWYYPALAQSGYALESGTSQATPFVAGAAALVWARWPTFSGDQVKAQLQGSVVDAGVPGRDDKTGWGRIDLARALAAPVSPVDLRLLAQVSPSSVVAGNRTTATFTITNGVAVPATSVTLDAVLPAEGVLEGSPGPEAGCSLSGVQMRCGVRRLESGASVSVSVVMTPTVVGNGLLTTTASVSAAQPELAPGDNTRTTTTEVRPVLSGRVFLDGNGDGIRQSWETRGISGAYLFLEQDFLPVDFEQSQSPDGKYQFDTVAPGSYSLTAELPPGYEFTTPDQVTLNIDAASAQSVYFGAWTGNVEPPSASPVFLPLVSRGQ